MTTTWQSKIDELIRSFHSRLSDMDRALAALEPESSRRVRRQLKSRRLAIAQLLAELDRIQLVRALEGHDNQMRIDLGLPPLRGICAEDLSPIREYLAERAKTSRGLSELAQKIRRWSVDLSSGSFGWLRGTLRLSGLRHALSQVEGYAKAAQKERQKIDRRLAKLAKVVGHDALPQGYEQTSLLMILRALDESQARVEKLERRLEAMRGALNTKARHLQELEEVANKPMLTPELPQLMGYLAEQQANFRWDTEEALEDVSLSQSGPIPPEIGVGSELLPQMSEDAFEEVPLKESKRSRKQRQRERRKHV